MPALSPAIKPAAARAMSVILFRLTRPLDPPPLDRPHEFMSEWLPERSPILRSWINHFIRTSVPYRVKTVNGRAMLYVHKLQPAANPRCRPRWCCKE